MNIFSKITDKSVYTQKQILSSEDTFIFGKDETLKPKFTKIFGINYAVHIYYIKIKSPELNLQENCINIYLPMSFRKTNNQELLNIILLKMYTKIAEQEIENVMEKARHIFGFAPEDYEIRKLNNCLANCDQDLQKIHIHPYLVTYTKEIVEYVIFHEFCHLKYKTHSKKFYNLLSKYQPNYQSIAKQIPNVKY